MQSTIGRHAARRALRRDDGHLKDQWHLLVDNIKDQTTFNPPTFPKGEIRASASIQAARRAVALVVIENGKIKNYRRGAEHLERRSARRQRPDRPLRGLADEQPDRRSREVAAGGAAHRCIPSTCVHACAIHMFDNEQRPIVKVRKIGFDGRRKSAVAARRQPCAPRAGHRHGQRADARRRGIGVPPSRNWRRYTLP